MSHVLIVEDHEENRNLLKLLLEVNGFRVTSACNGLEALDAARRNPPDAVVSDALMPKMDGFALCRAWTRDAGLKSIPFIFCSANSPQQEDQEFGLALGAARYLAKPVEAEVLLRELRAVLEPLAAPGPPGPTPPLDDITFHALHKSALGRAVENKIAELEAANRRLEESETRFRSLTEMSSDFYWESDAEHRLIVRSSAAKKSSTVSVFERGAQIGERRWGIPYLSPDEAGWQAHRALLDAHQPFRDFELSRLGTDGTERFISISGDPAFDASGMFTGYRGVGTDISARKRAEKSLRESEERLRAIFDGVLDGILVADTETRRFVTANPEICHMFGYTQEEMFGLGVPDIHPQQDLPRMLAQFERQLGGEIQLSEDAPLLRKDGSVFYADIKAARIRLGGKDAVLGIFRDTTGRRAAEAKIQRLTQLYAALSQCNQAIVRCASEDELFPQICRVAVEYGGMKMAWIGMVDADTRMVRVAASFGEHAEEYLHGAEISVDAGSPLGRGPSGAAVRDQRPVWQQDFRNEPITAPWHARRARSGFGASASLPLQRNGVAVGVLTLYAGEAGAFDEAARNLLVEMATDIGFALDNFALEAARVRAEHDLRVAEEQFRGLVEQSIAGIYIIQDDRFAYVNPRFAEIFGYASADELIGRESLSLVTEKERGAVLELRRRIEGEVQSMSYAFTAVCKDGAQIEVGVHSARARHNGRPAVIGMAQDISEKKRAEEQIQRYVMQLETGFMSTVQVATTLGEMRDPYTAGHQRRVAEIAVAIGAELGFDARRQEGLRVAGYLHDIGKITIPAEILSKPGKLSSNEYLLVQGHAQSSYDVLKDVQFPWPVAEVALQHHERIDGSGYPQGLKGEAILLEARIMAVADVVEAMSTHRPYRPGLGVDKALAEIERGRATAYDAEVADACLRLFREQGYRLPA